MSKLQLAGAPSGVSTSVTGRLAHLCPFREEVDQGEVTLRWTTDGETVELHSLAAWLESFAPLVISHEELTDQLATALQQFRGLRSISVTTTWETAGLAITCHSSKESR